MSALSALSDEAPGRGAVPGLRTPFPIVQFTPGMLADDMLVQLLLEALDEVLAPVISTMDCMDAYLDPELAPIDMVKYLGSWLLAEVDDEWDDDAVRRDVRQAHARSKWAGTARSVTERLVPYEVESLVIEDPGYTACEESHTKPADWSDPDPPEVVLRVVPKRAGAAELRRLERLARGLVPAHVSVRVVDSR